MSCNGIVLDGKSKGQQSGKKVQTTRCSCKPENLAPGDWLLHCCSRKPDSKRPRWVLKVVQQQPSSLAGTQAGQTRSFRLARCAPPEHGAQQPCLGQHLWREGGDAGGGATRRPRPRGDSCCAPPSSAGSAAGGTACRGTKPSRGTHSRHSNTCAARVVDTVFPHRGANLMG